MAAVFAAVSVGALCPGCPSRDLQVNVTSSGMFSVVAACEGFTSVCDADDDVTSCDPVFCYFDTTCKLRNPCSLPGNPGWQGAATKAVQMILFSTSPLQSRAHSTCICVDSEDFSCASDIDAGAPPCNQIALNDHLADAIPGGLGYSGLTHPESSALAMAVFQAPAGVTSCAAIAASGEDLCVPGNMVACLGLSVPIGGSAYDVTCATCQGSARQAIGTNTQPCPTTGQECFLETCSAALFGAADGGI